MTPEISLRGPRALLFVASSLVLLTVFWVTPLPRNYQRTVGSLLLELWGNPVCSGRFVCVLSATLCWWQWETRARHLPASKGHWLWIAGAIAGILLYVAGIRGGAPLLSLAMLPIILACGITWVAGFRFGSGFLFPIVLLYASAPPLAVMNLHSLWQSKLNRLFLEWFGPELVEWRSVEVVGRFYDYYPRPGNCIVIAVSLCWLLRGSWKRALAVCLSAVGLICGHVALFGAWSGC